MKRQLTSYRDFLLTVSNVSHPDLRPDDCHFLLCLALDADGHTGKGARPGHVALAKRIKVKALDTVRLRWRRCADIGVIVCVHESKGKGDAHVFDFNMSHPAFPDEYPSMTKAALASLALVSGDGARASLAYSSDVPSLTLSSDGEDDRRSDADESSLLDFGPSLTKTSTIAELDSTIAASSQRPSTTPSKALSETTSTTTTTTKKAPEWLWWLWRAGRERHSDYEDQFGQNIGSSLNAEDEDIAEIELLCQRYDPKIVTLAWAAYAFQESPPYDSRTRRPAYRFWKDFERIYLEPATVQRERCRQFGWEHEGVTEPYIKACVELIQMQREEP
jgi:hypothetical protein